VGFRFCKTEIFFKYGLDRGNRVDLVAEIRFLAQRFLATEQDLSDPSDRCEAGEGSQLPALSDRTYPPDRASMSRCNAR